jgi:hypothetical protein
MNRTDPLQDSNINGKFGRTLTGANLPSVSPRMAGTIRGNFIDHQATAHLTGMLQKCAAIVVVASSYPIKVTNRS